MKKIKTAQMKTPKEVSTAQDTLAQIDSKVFQSAHILRALADPIVISTEPRKLCTKQIPRQSRRSRCVRP